MSDQRYTDPRYGDPRDRDAILGNRPASVAGGWIASLCLMVLIVALVIAGIYRNPDRDAASNSGTLITRHGIPMTPPGATGSGSESPKPLTSPPRR